MLISNCLGSGSGGLNNLEFTLYQDSSIVILTNFKTVALEKNFKDFPLYRFKLNFEPPPLPWVQCIWLEVYILQKNFVIDM